MVLALQSASTAFRDPTRDDAVASLGELTGSLALHRMRQEMRSHPIGQQILHDRPLVTQATIPYDELLKQGQAIQLSSSSSSSTTTTTPPEDITFGQAVGAFWQSHEFNPDERKAVQHIHHDEELAYVMTRYRQCHDYWHALTGLPPTVLGELGLKWLELFQTGLPVAALSCTVGTLGLDYPQQQILWHVYLPWATKIHRAQQQRQQQQSGGAVDGSCSLMTVYYEREFDTPLQELRDRLCIEPAPDVGEEYKY